MTNETQRLAAEDAAFVQQKMAEVARRAQRVVDEGELRLHHQRLREQLAAKRSEGSSAAISTDAEYAAHVAQTGRCPFVGPCDSRYCSDLQCADVSGGPVVDDDPEQTRREVEADVALNAAREEEV